MRIYIRETGGRTIFVPLPSCLLFSGAAARMAVRYAGPALAEAGFPLTGNQLSRLFRAARRSKRLLGGKPLVEASSAEGDVVTVYL